MSVYTTIKAAIEARHCVEILAGGHRRVVCPHVLGRKAGRPKVLVFQCDGGSDSGLAPSGGWRCFPLFDIVEAKPVSGTWHTAHDFIAKSEVSLDQIECVVRTASSSMTHH